LDKQAAGDLISREIVLFYACVMRQME